MGSAFWDYWIIESRRETQTRYVVGGEEGVDPTHTPKSSSSFVEEYGLGEFPCKADLGPSRKRVVRGIHVSGWRLPLYFVTPTWLGVMVPFGEASILLTPWLVARVGGCFPGE